MDQLVPGELRRGRSMDAGRADMVGLVLGLVGAGLLMPSAAQASSTTGDDYVSVPQARLYSTTTGQGGVPIKQIQPGTSVTFPVDGVDGVPSSGVDAVVIVLNAQSPSGSGDLKAFPSGSSVPTSNSLLYNDGVNATNTAIVPMDNTGDITVWNGSGVVDSTATVMGYFISSGSSGASTNFSPTTLRLVDTRKATGVSTIAPVAAGATLTVHVAGTNGIPSTATKAMVNISSVNAAGVGTFKAWATGEPEPSYVVGGYSSTGQSSCLTAVKLGADGSFNLKVNVASTDVLVDVEGYFQGASPGSGTAFYSDDSRTYDSTAAGEVPLAPGETRQVLARPDESLDPTPVVALRVSAIAGATAPDEAFGCGRPVKATQG